MPWEWDSRKGCRQFHRKWWQRKWHPCGPTGMATPPETTARTARPPLNYSSLLSHSLAPQAHCTSSKYPSCPSLPLASTASKVRFFLSWNGSYGKEDNKEACFSKWEGFGLDCNNSKSKQPLKQQVLLRWEGERGKLRARSRVRKKCGKESAQWLTGWLVIVISCGGGTQIESEKRLVWAATAKRFCLVEFGFSQRPTTVSTLSLES